MQQPIIDLLTKQSTARLHAMRQDVAIQIQDLQVQAHWIEQAILEKEGASTPVSGSANVTGSASRRTRRGGTSDAIRRVVNREPDRVWAPAEIIEEVRALGVSSSAQAIRVALRRLGDNNFLQRGPDGTGWQLASANGSLLGEPSTGAPSVGLGGMGGKSPWPPNDGSGAIAAPNQSG